MFVLGGTTAEKQEVGNAAALAAHVTCKPLPVGSLGQYRIAATTGELLPLAAAGVLFFVRWTDATRFFVLHKFKARVQGLGINTSAALTQFGFDLFKATSFTEAGTGGTDLGLLAKTKMRSTMGASLLDTTDAMRIGTTTTIGPNPIAGQDATAFAQSLGRLQRVNPAAGTEEARLNDPTLTYIANTSSGEHPIVLGQDEGVLLRNRVLWPSFPDAQTGIVQVEMVWSEVTGF